MAKKANLKPSIKYLESDEMKYFVFSDIHGCINELNEALNNNGYNPKDDNHKLLFLGDAFDKNKNDSGMLSFLLENIKNNKLIWVRGNHEIYLLNSLKNKKAGKFTINTIKHLAKYYNSGADDNNIDECLNILINNNLYDFINNNTIDYYELNKYVFVHSFIPFNKKDNTYNPNWRDISFGAFIHENGIKRVLKDGIKIPNKTVVSGHVGCHYGNIMKYNPNIIFGSKEFNKIKYNIEKCPKNNLNYFQTFISNNIIGLDGRCYETGKVNVLIVEE